MTRTNRFTITVSDPQPYFQSVLHGEPMFVNQPEWVGRAIVTAIDPRSEDGLYRFVITLQPIGEPVS